MAGKIACDGGHARNSGETLINPRGRMPSREGVRAAASNAQEAICSGPRIALFIEAPRRDATGESGGKAFVGRAPDHGEYGRGGASRSSRRQDLPGSGALICGLSGGIVRAVECAPQRSITRACTNGSNVAFSGRMHDFEGLNERLGTALRFGAGARFEGKGRLTL